MAAISSCDNKGRMSNATDPRAICVHPPSHVDPRQRTTALHPPRLCPTTSWRCSTLSRVLSFAHARVRPSPLRRSTRPKDASPLARIQKSSPFQSQSQLTFYTMIARSLEEYRCASQRYTIDELCIITASRNYTYRYQTRNSRKHITRYSSLTSPRGPLHWSRDD